MELTFLGTRGYIDSCSAEHRRHSALLLSYRSQRLMIDCGEDWLGRLDSVAPDAILITHAHPDHALGLQEGAGCPVYATRECWEGLDAFAIADRREIRAREPFDIGAIRVEAFAVIHSIRAPAVGLRIGAGSRAIFYVPDVIDIDSRAEALSGVDLYVGDGATLTRPLVRRWEGRIFGHTTIRAQLGWCRETGVRRAIFTHCGKEIVEGDPRAVEAEVGELGRERGVEATIAFDGLPFRIK